MVYVPLAVVKIYMKNKWLDRGDRPETRREQRQEILLQWYIWLGFYPDSYKSLAEFNNQLAEYYGGEFRAEVNNPLWEGRITWSR